MRTAPNCRRESGRGRVLFSVEADSGTEIIGYVVPDDYERSSLIRVTHAGEEVGVFPCDEERASLVAAGRHSTGMCGFRINEAKAPGLGEMRDVSLHDVDSGLLIYRRSRNENARNIKMFRLETHLFPLWRQIGRAHV